METAFLSGFGLFFRCYVSFRTVYAFLCIYTHVDWVGPKKPRLLAHHQQDDMTFFGSGNSELNLYLPLAYWEELFQTNIYVYIYT